MNRLQEQLLLEVESQHRFSAHKSEYHLIQNHKGSTTYHETLLDLSDLNPTGLTLPFTNHNDLSTSTDPPSPTTPPTRPNPRSSLWKCIFQRTRPTHISGQPDPLPFPNIPTITTLFQALNLPSTYFQICDGSLASAQAHTLPSSHSTGPPVQFDLIAHCPTRQGDWAMALSHHAATRTTTIFWSVDARIDSARLLADLALFRDYACHPLLAPCIMLAATLRMAIDRRHSIKARLRILEERVRELRKRAMHDDGGGGGEVESLGGELDELFEILHGCRAEQGSREGRYDFWKSFYDAMMEGFRYADLVLVRGRGEGRGGKEGGDGDGDGDGDEKDCEVHRELLRWTQVTWQRLESLKARDRDHITRVDNVSNLLCDLVHQRDSRIQAKIARASQRDSEDMKFIALLGSVFLPASLVATLLNVPEFQFLPGSKLFGVYLAVTVPFIGFVVLLCLLRPHWQKWTQGKSQHKSVA